MNSKNDVDVDVDDYIKYIFSKKKKKKILAFKVIKF